MIRILNTLLLIIVISISLLQAEQSRFLRVLDQYTNHIFTHEKRGVIFNYVTNTNPEIDKILSSDTAVFHDRLQQFALSYQSTKRTNSLENERTLFYSVGFNSIYDFLDHSPSGNEYYLDTLSYLLELQGNITLELSRFFIRDHGIKKSFLELLSTVNTQAYYSNKKGYDPDLESLEISQLFKSDWITQQKLNTTFFIDVSPAAGIGKQVNTLPVYQVFKLEKELVKKGVASFKLSEKTLVAIAELLANNNTYAFKKLDKTKEFKEKMDTIIVKDEAVKKESLRYISPLDIKKILLCNAPLFMARPQLKLITTSRLVPSVSRNETTFPFDFLDFFNDTVFTNFKFRYEHYLGIEASWGIPLTTIWFLNLNAVRNLISTDREIDFYDEDNHIKWDEVLDIRLSLQTSLWPTNWLLFQTGVANLPTWLGVPNKGPYHIFLSGNLFIEDYLTLSATFSYYNNQAHHVSYTAWSEPLSHMREGFHFHVRVNYNF